MLSLLRRLQKNIDMFPPTDTAKNAMAMFPRTNSSKDINAILSSHVETVVLMERID
jgi:hypothetical protein